MNNSVLMIQGTTSDAGKTALVTGLCRVLARQGVSVCPFKPQNMALNSAVTVDGGEIGRAQALQAQASNIQPSVDMNPVLIKPSSDTGAQVIFQGKVEGNIQAIGFSSYKLRALPVVMSSFQTLKNQYQMVIVEGAGSPAEINLRENDIANMGFAEPADVPVVIVADIDKGGVFAHLYGTLMLLSDSEQARVKGFVINKFRGDISLLMPGVEWLEQKTGKPVLGVLPYLRGLELAAEDAISTAQPLNAEVKLKVVVPVLPRISNHTDFDMLRLNPDIEFTFVGEGKRLQGADLIILPGSKSVVDDLNYLREQHWDKDIYRHLRHGGKVLGICGGYQMLGKELLDPDCLEGNLPVCQGLGLLKVSTRFAQQKKLLNQQGQLTLNGQIAAISGYEIHMGETRVAETQPITLDNGEQEGALSECGQVLGTYLHGILDTPQGLALLSEWVVGAEITSESYHDIQERSINLIADAMEKHLNFTAIWPWWPNLGS